MLRRQFWLMLTKSKFNSKRDIYFFYCFEMTAYLPPHKTITIYFLKQLMDGTKKVINTYFKIIYSL